MEITEKKMISDKVNETVEIDKIKEYQESIKSNFNNFLIYFSIGVFLSLCYFVFVDYEPSWLPHGLWIGLKSAWFIMLVNSIALFIPSLIWSKIKLRKLLKKQSLENKITLI